jgi:hypothetical protein
MNKLKNCPCCGGKAKIKSAKYNTLGAYGSKETEKQWWGIYCTECGLTQPSRKYHSKEESITAWNNRCNDTNHGYWFFTEYEYFDCSVCGEAYYNGCDSSTEARYRLKTKYDLYKKCPYCGAIMDLMWEKIKEDDF